MVAKKGRGQKRKSNYERKSIPADEKAVVCYCPKVCPDVMRVCLRYSENKTLSGLGLADLAKIVYRGNSIFDPDFTGVGHQPLGHDEWNQFYRRYRVIGSKMKVLFASDSAVNVTVGVTPLNTSGGYTIGDTYKEATYSKSIVIGGDAMHGLGTVETYMPVNKIRAGPPNLVRYEEDYAAVFGSNPNKEFFWHVWCHSMDGGTNMAANVTIELTYYVELYDRETLTQS